MAAVSPAAHVSDDVCGSELPWDAFCPEHHLENDPLILLKTSEPSCVWFCLLPPQPRADARVGTGRACTIFLPEGLPGAVPLQLRGFAKPEGSQVFGERC